MKGIPNLIRGRSDYEAENELRKRLRISLQLRSRRHQGLSRVIKAVRQRGWSAYLFGGFPRDLAIFGARAIPRDLDIVVDNIDVNEIAEAFRENIRRRTRFGGLALTILDWDIDIWPVRETWALRSVSKGYGIEQLPRTTFLNVEAIVVEIGNADKKRRRVYENEFFEGVRNRCLEVNSGVNPYPTLCVVRSLLLAAKLDFAIGTSLCTYIEEHADMLRVDDINEIQVSHYGQIKQSGSTLLAWIESIRKHHSNHPGRAYMFPSLFGRQLGFFDNTSREFRGQY